MPPAGNSAEASPEREPFLARWTGVLAIGLFIYIPVTLLLTFAVDGKGGQAFEIFKLYSDFPASLGSAVLAIVASRRAADATVRRAWAFLGAAVSVYTVGNLLNSTYWVFGVDPFPSVGDVFFLGFYPLLFTAILIAIRAAAVHVPWGRLALDAIILMLGFGAFFWFFVIAPAAAADRDPDMVKYVLSQSYIGLNCLMLLSFGILLMHAGAGAIARRTLILLTIGFSTMSIADIVWAMAKVTGTYLPGGLSDALYISCYAWLIAAAREQIRGAPAIRQEPTALGSAAVQGMPYVAMLVSFLVLVYVESSSMSSPATAMTVIIFALTLLVMLRQGVISRDDALLRERRAAGIVEARYASLIKNASDVIMIVDVDGRLRFASPAAERTFGMLPDDLVGRNLLDDPAIAGLALNFRDVSERKALEEQLRQLAFHDPLTLLANRSLFRNRVQHALTLAQRSRQRVAVLFLDLDNFKNVNDSLGHDAGDRLLQAAAQRLVKSTRPSDTVARLGGDEFAILLEGISESADVERVAATITRSFDEPLQLDGSDTYMAASIGIAFSQPGDDTEQLLRNADIAMYNAKAAGKARFVVFQPRMQEQLRERLRLEDDINCALERGEFFLEYQPVVDLDKRELLGVEALVRWNHPEQGLVMPGAFISAAEESGQIIELGRWVLTEACRAVKEWRDSVVAGEGLRVAINVSGRHLQHADLVADVRAALDASGLEPENLVIELTESTIMHNTEVNLERFRELKSLGVRLAIDDFGMGYSSLSYLHRFPIDILKIDRSFVGRLTEQDDGPELARAVVMLGETLGLETVAEGVEHEEQVEKLLELGCVAAQGFLFARSASLADVSAMPFSARRAELRAAQTMGDRLTATGRFNVGHVRPRSVA